MSTETNPPTAATRTDGWDQPPVGYSDDWDLLTDVGPDTTTPTTTDHTVVDGPAHEPSHEELLLSEACRLLDDTEHYAVEDLGEEGTGESRMIARTDAETAAKVRLSATYAAIASASAADAQTSIMALHSLDVADGLTRLADVADRQCAVLAELARHTEENRRAGADRAAALIDAEYAASTSRAGFYALAALIFTVWAAIGGPRPEWSWVPQDALPGWLPAAAGFTALALAAIGALITATRYGQARYRWSIRG